MSDLLTLNTYLDNGHYRGLCRRVVDDIQTEVLDVVGSEHRLQGLDPLKLVTHPSVRSEIMRNVDFQLAGVRQSTVPVQFSTGDVPTEIHTETIQVIRGFPIPMEICDDRVNTTVGFHHVATNDPTLHENGRILLVLRSYITGRDTIIRAPVDLAYDIVLSGPMATFERIPAEGYAFDSYYQLAERLSHLRHRVDRSDGDTEGLRRNIGEVHIAMGYMRNAAERSRHQGALLTQFRNLNDLISHAVEVDRSPSQQPNFQVTTTNASDTSATITTDITYTANGTEVAPASVILGDLDRGEFRQSHEYIWSEHEQVARAHRLPYEPSPAEAWVA